MRQSFNRRATSITAVDKRFGQRIAGSRDPNAVLPRLETPDPYTFRFKMMAPFTPALRELAKPEWAIVPAKAIEKYGYFFMNPEIDKLIDSQSREMDPQRRREIIYEVQRLIIKQHAPVITLPSGYACSAHAAYVHGIGVGEFPGTGGGNPPGCDIWTEKA